ncbi:MAG: DNA polymerase IV [Rhodanobacter sp.]
MSATARKILHVDMDAFYASVAQRDDRSLRGKAVAVAWHSSRSVVLTASYEARVFGVHSAMPVMRAQRLCPQLLLVPPDFVRYHEVSQQVRAIFARHTNLVEPLSLDEAYLDVSALASGLPSATATAAAIRTAIREETGLTASAGVAGNKFLAKIASDWNKPDGLFVIRPQQALAFLSPLPVGRLPGVGKVTEARLAALGLITVADVRARSCEELQAHLGRWGQRLHELALGIDDHPVQPHRPTLQISSEDTFEHDLTLGELEPAIRTLANHTWASHERDRTRVGRTAVLKLKTADFHTLTRSLTPSTPPQSASELGDIACALCDRVERPADSLYRLVGVGLAGFVAADSFAAQAQLFANVE